MSRLLLVVLTLSIPGLCATQQVVEEELRRAYELDQSSRGSDGPTDPCGDTKRRLRVLELLANGMISTPSAKYYAAVILQHTPQGEIGSKLISNSAENYMLAHFLARSAANAGHDAARYLSAAAYDRYLVSQGEPQKYGTQFTLNPETGALEFSPVDPATTDAERAEWDVPPLEATIRRFEESDIERRRRPLPFELDACLGEATSASEPR